MLEVGKWGYENNFVNRRSTGRIVGRRFKRMNELEDAGLYKGTRPNRRFIELWMFGHDKIKWKAEKNPVKCQGQFQNSDQPNDFKMISASSKDIKMPVSKTSQKCKSSLFATGNSGSKPFDSFWKKQQCNFIFMINFVLKSQQMVARTVKWSNTQEPSSRAQNLEACHFLGLFDP